MSKQIEYIDTGVNWLGKIPSTWESKRIKMLTRVKRGASPRPIDNPIYFDEEGEFAWVRIADVTASERYLENTTQRLSELGSSLSVKRYPDDFFLSIAGTVGKPIITKIKCCIHDGFVYFPDLKVNPEFLYYIFSTGLPYLGLGKMGTQLNLNTDTVGDIYIPIPDEKEIEKIVKHLDERTAEIDSLISKKQKLIDCLKEERMSIITEAVTKGINPKAEMKDSGIEWLGHIPKHWNVKKLKYLSRLRDEQIDGSDFKIAVENIESFSGRIVGLEEEKKYQGSLSAFKQGDTIFNKLRPYLHKVYYAEKDGGLFGELLILYSLGELTSKFLYFKLFDKYFIDLVDGSTQGTKMPRANWEDFIKEQLISYPIDKSEQNQIVSYIEDQTQSIATTIGKIEEEISLIKEYRTSLINEVVTGKITLN